MNKQFGNYLGAWCVRNTTSDSRGNIYKTKLLLIVLLFLGSMFSNAHAVPMNYLGAWDPTIIYAVGSVVSFDNASYYSLRSSVSAPNKSKIPNNKPLWWKPLGTVGNTVHNGITAPILSIGNVGDFYIDTANNTMYGPKTAIGWPIANISLV